MICILSDRVRGRSWAFVGVRGAAAAKFIINRELEAIQEEKEVSNAWFLRYPPWV